MNVEKTIYQLKNITKSYGDDFALDIPIVDFIRGETCALVGPNGSGKTTLLRLLAFVERPTSGEILFESTRVWNGATTNSVPIRRVTMVAHPPFLFNRTVVYNIGYGLKLRGKSRKEIRTKTMEVLETVGLAGFEKKNARTLSSGQQQRVALARALALEPEVLLLDEPTASIDKKYARDVESLIRQLRLEARTTVIFSTHNYRQASVLADRIIFLSNGRIESLPYENIFRGTVNKCDGETRIFVSESLGFIMNSDAAGPAHISIDSRDIMLSRRSAANGSLNCHRGKIVRMTLHESYARLTVDIGVRLSVVVSEQALSELQPKLGEDVYCSFDAGAVRII
ncbi:MAG: ABC transporter ATP-binding protein [Candidatus Lindowbacteria bacterium]|nr:ABC transporter ATP-binding protein [Candidatus Lindowbacteria bacterium]